jgi:DNA-binding NarL/FixJ family response regulator
MENHPSLIKVSIVEDNAFIRGSLEKLIHDSPGLEMVGSFDSGESAVSALPTLSPDIVLMDIDMGVMDGIEAVRILKVKCPSILFIMCTRYEDNEKIFDALRAGACGYILKKGNPEDIVSAIKDAYKGGAPMSGEIASKVVASFRTPAPVSNLEMEVLTQRESEILEHLVRGQLYKEIAASLDISQETVRKHVYHIYKKLHVNNRVEAFHKYYGSNHKE